MKVKEIGFVTTYRDGGSYGMEFRAKSGGLFSKSKWYEFFIQNRAFEENPGTDYLPPKIFLEDCNSGEIVSELTWAEAEAFISGLSYPDERFDELVQIIKRHGKNT